MSDQIRTGVSSVTDWNNGPLYYTHHRCCRRDLHPQCCGYTAFAQWLYNIGASALPSLRVLSRPLVRQWNWHWKRELELHQRPLGYEPNELLLLYLAIVVPRRAASVPYKLRLFTPSLTGCIIDKGVGGVNRCGGDFLLVS